MQHENSLDFYLKESPTHQLLPECHALARYILVSGKKISPEMLQKLAMVELSISELAKGNQPAHPLPQTAGECSGILSRVHAHCCDIISPAIPRTVLLLEEQRDIKGWRMVLGPVPLIRRLMVMAIASLLLLLLVSLHPKVTGAPESFDFTRSSGIGLLLNYLFLIAASGLGASFAALFQSNSYVREGTFDPKYDHSYLNRLLLGITAGMIMAVFFPIEKYSSIDLQGLGKPLIAILGGFSSSAVHRILSRIVGALESLLKGDPKVENETVVDVSRARASQKAASLRMELASKLTNLNGMLQDENNQEEVKAALNEIQQELFVGETGTLSPMPVPVEEPVPAIELGAMPTADSDTQSPEQDLSFVLNPKIRIAHKLRKQLLIENLAMMDFTNDAGRTAPPEVASRLERLSHTCRSRIEAPINQEDPSIIARLTEIHNILIDLILPSTPRSILHLISSGPDGSSTNLLRFRGSVTVVYQMRLMVVISLAAMVGFSLFGSVNGQNIELDSPNKDPLTLMLNYMFLLSAASMGACFSGLFTANEYIKNGTFDNLFQSTYWSRYVLGLMGGMMIAILVPLEMILGSSNNGGPESGQGVINSLGPSLMALLGGFAANFVYRLLDKLVKVMESMVKADPKEALASREIQAQTKLAARSTQDRMDQVREIHRIQGQLSENSNIDEVRKALSEMQQRLINKNNFHD